MPGILQRRFYSTIRAPSAEALELLASRSANIDAKWRSEISALGHEQFAILAGTPLDFSQLAGQLRKATYPEFKRHVRQFGQALSQAGIRIGVAVATLNRLYEISLQNLLRVVPRRKRLVLALARLHALVGLILVSGYTGRRLEGEQTILDAGSAGEKIRRHGASAYVTRIYEQEWRRFSQDLHDEIGHDLILIKLYLEMIALEHKETRLEDIQPRIAEAIALVSHSIDAVRRLVLDLGPAVLDDLGFLPAIRSYLSQFATRTRIKVALQEGPMPKDIAMGHQVALYRVMQGALSNVMKHASAKNVKVSLGSRTCSVLMMVVEDDGIGFDTTARVGRRSFGLTAMRERVEVLGGKFQVHSKPAGALTKSHGTRIEVDLPVPGGAQK